jgi:hypothetical protein
MKHFHEKKLEAERAAKAFKIDGKQMGGLISKMIVTYWKNAEKAST